jgi:hypothetical protein
MEEDRRIGIDAMGNETPGGEKPTGIPPKRQSPIDQTKAVAKKVLATITGRPKS